MAPARHAGGDRVKQSRADLRRFWSEPALRKRYEQMRHIPRTQTASVEETLALIKAEKEAWAPIVRQIEAD